MRRIKRTLHLLWLFVALVLLTDRAHADYTLKPAGKPPSSVPAALRDALNPHGWSVQGDGKNITVWFVKRLPVQKGFSPGFNVKYGFPQGALIGLLQISGEGVTDFRAQELQPGLYTLRYARQPEDGNHVGTSETLDFLVGVRVADDPRPDPATDLMDLMKRSAKAAGTTHPMIFYLPPAEDPVSKPRLVHDEDYDLWILELPLPGRQAEKDITVSVRLVVVGHAEE